MLKKAGETKDESDNNLTRRAIVGAMNEFDGHVMRRAVTVNQDEVLTLDRHGELTVATREFYVMDEVGEYWCSCDQTFDDWEAAQEHLQDGKSNA